MSDGWTVYDPPLDLIGNSDKFQLGMLMKLSCEDDPRGWKIILVGHMNNEGGFCGCCCLESMWDPSNPKILASKRIWTPEERNP